MFDVLEYAPDMLPKDKPRYLMGVGKPDDIVGAVKRCIDMMDCVLPSRSGRTGQVFTRRGVLNIKNARHQDDPRPLDEECTCPACTGYSRAYLHHVFRSQEMISALGEVESKLRDPDSEALDMQPAFARNANRSLKPEVLVLVGICTHLGCSPTFRPELAPADLGADWKGGFYCPCHGSLFDISGRVYKNVPANNNLEVPPYKYLSDNVLLIGELDEEQGAV